MMQEPKHAFDDLHTGGNFAAFSVGAPGPSCLEQCKQILKKATILQLDSEKPSDIFQYGTNSGDPDFKRELANFLSREYGDPVRSDNLMVTAGATNGLHLIASVLFDERTPVFVEELTYFIGIDIFRNDLRRKIISVPMDNDGINISELDRILTLHKPTITASTQKYPFWSFVYLIPTFHNPTSRCLSPNRCKQLIELAKRHCVLLVCDDVYNLISYEKEKIPRLLAYDKSDPKSDGHVLSNGSFSKLFAPGLRLGWIEAHPRILNQLTSSGGSFNQYTSVIMTRVLSSGLQAAHLKNMCKVYKKRMDYTYQMLRKNLPLSVKFEKPRGGFFIWIELPENTNTENFAEEAVKKYKLDFVSGSRFSPQQKFKNYMRISISYCDDCMLEDGVHRLCQLIVDKIDK